MLFSLIIIFFSGYLALVLQGRDVAAGQVFELVKALVFAAAGLVGGYGFARAGS